MMVKDHGELLKSVYGLATKLNVTPQMSDKAADLDKEFMDEQIDWHQETIGVLKDLDEKTKDATLKSATTPVESQRYFRAARPGTLFYNRRACAPERDRSTNGCQTRTLVRPELAGGRRT